MASRLRHYGWILAVGVGALAAIVAVLELASMAAISTLLVGCFALLLALPTFVDTDDATGAGGTPGGLMAAALGATISVFALQLPTVWLSAAAVLVAGALVAFGSIHIVGHRVGGRPKISERETGILAAGVALIYFVIVVEPGVGGGNELALGLAVTLGAFSTFFGGAFFAWLIGTDMPNERQPLLLVGAGYIVMFSGLVMASLEAMTITKTPQACLFGGAALLCAGALHPSAARALAPVVIAQSEVNPRRTLTSFLFVLIGPVLIVVDLITEMALSLPILTIGSSVISLMVALHLLELIRHWVAIEHQGQHDALTSLPNRPLFFSRLELAMESASQRGTQFATMFLDLDRFKAVNDTLGHDAGDELLRQVAERLNEAARRVGPDLTVARLGGDEFSILVPHVNDDRHAHAIGRLFLDQFIEPFDVGLRDIYVTPSIGLAQFPKDGNSVDELIENADTAMFEAKERGRNTVVSYSPEQRVPGAHRLEIEAALHKAIERREMQLVYQPQVDVTTGEIVAVESLLRWLHPTLGQIGPDKFVQVAEESSLIDQIGIWALEEACHAAAGWKEKGLPPINVAVNLSPRQFQNPVHLTDNVARTLRGSGLEAGRLELELTESLALEKPEEVNQTLSEFRAMGIRTAIDDFGVGHTGLDYLDRIIVDTLKIDRSFIMRIGESGAPLVTAVISLARGLNLDVIAEGVETREQMEFLRDHGCRMMQGYLFSKPLTGSQLERVLLNQMQRQQAAPPEQLAG